MSEKNVLIPYGNYEIVSSEPEDLSPLASQTVTPPTPVNSQESDIPVASESFENIPSKTEPIRKTTPVRPTTTQAKTTPSKKTTTIKTTTPRPKIVLTDDTAVWISQSGSKYHINSKCSGMKNPAQSTVAEAQALGKTPCGKCITPYL